jgi:hypothetical protein
MIAEIQDALLPEAPGNGAAPPPGPAVLRSVGNQASSYGRRDLQILTHSETPTSYLSSSVAWRAPGRGHGSQNSRTLARFQEQSFVRGRPGFGRGL